MAETIYQALARKWRPQTFDDVIAQPQVTQTLKNAIASGRIHHAYLFCGPRGTGKTTTARILAKALNCVKGPTAQPCNTCPICVGITQGSCLDVLEIDAASNTGVDNVRDLRESSQLVPASARFKIYIIDEVHRLSKPAFDALLKTLEEPPASVKFIFATTEVHDVPVTVRSRALRFDFHLIPQATLREQLARIAAAEGIDIEPDATDIIAVEAAGSLRDAQSLLDQVASYAGGTITASLTNDALGLVDADVLFRFTDALAVNDPAAALAVVGEVSRAGRDFAQFARQVAEHLKRLLFARSLGEGFADEALGSEQRERYQEAARAREENDWLRFLLMAIELGHRVHRGAPQPLLELEMFALRASRMEHSVDIRALIERAERQVVIPGLLRAGGAVESGTLPLTVQDPVADPPSPTPRGSVQQDKPPRPLPAVTPKKTEPAGGQSVDFEPILEAICQHRPTLQAVLGHARLVRTHAGAFELHVYHGSTFHSRQLAEKPIRDLIHAEISRALGEGARVTIHVKEGAPGSESPKAEPAAARARSPQRAAASDPAREESIRGDHAVQEILRRFDGEIVE